MMDVRLAVTSILVAVALTCAAADLSTTTADAFEFSTRNYGDYTRTMLGNGYLFGTTSWNGASPSSATLAGLYGHLQLRSYLHQALIPSWNGIDFWDGYQLNQMEPQTAQLSGYVQTLDAYNGVLTTRYDWQDGDRSRELSWRLFRAARKVIWGSCGCGLPPTTAWKPGLSHPRFPWAVRQKSISSGKVLSCPALCPSSVSKKTRTGPAFWRRPRPGTANCASPRPFE